MINFDRICRKLNTSWFGGNFDIIFEFRESKNIPRGIFKTRGYFKQKLSKKMLFLAVPIIINLLFFKNIINSEPLGVRG